MGSSADNNGHTDSIPLPPPLDGRAWEAVVRELKLAPQHERIVRLIMLSKRDKQIALELDLAAPTVRTCLKRVFERAGVTDRMELVHRVYAVAIDAWSRDQCPSS